MKNATQDDLLNFFRQKSLALNNVVRATHVMSQLLSITEIYIICLLFERPRKKSELYELLCRDLSTKAHAMRRLRQKELVEETSISRTDTLVKLSTKGSAIYAQLISLMQPMQADNSASSC